MSERCEVCGARWAPDADNCRDCGAPKVAPPAPSSVVSPVVQPVVAAASEPLPIPGRATGSGNNKMLGIAAAAAVVVAATVGLVIAFAGSETDASASDDSGKSSAKQIQGVAECPEELASLEGSWVFTTVATGARKKKRLGMRGYYELVVRLDNCEPTAELTKVGRTGAETYDEAHKHHASAALTRGDGPRAFGFGAVFEPRNEAGQGIPKRFVFTVDGDRLVGTWRQRGAKWRSSGQFGPLEGRRDGDPRDLRPRRSSLPCRVECALPQNIEAADAEAEVTGLDACLANCE